MEWQEFIEFAKVNWKRIAIGFLVFIILCVGYYKYRKHEAISMTTIQANIIEENTKAINNLGIQDKITPQELKSSIDKANTSTPQNVFVTATQKDADKQANNIAKVSKADAIIKQTTQTAESSKGIESKYYGIHLEKDNKIKAGITVLDSQIYENIAYQHKKDEIIVHMQLEKTQLIKGVTYMRTLAEW